MEEFVKLLRDDCKIKPVHMSFLGIYLISPYFIVTLSENETVPIIYGSSCAVFSMQATGDSLSNVKPDDGWNGEPAIQGEVEGEERILSTMLNQMMDEIESQVSKER